MVALRAYVSAWPFVPVNDVFQKSARTVLPESLGGPVTYLGLENITQNTGQIEGEVITEKPADIKSLKNIFKPRDILYGKLRPNLNKVWLADREGICSTDIFVIEALEEKADPALYAFLFRSGRFNNIVMGQLKGAQLPRIGWSSFAELQIPLPPLETQKEIVAEIESYQKVINGAQAVLDNYRPYIAIHPDWPRVKLESVTTIVSGYNFDSKCFSNTNPIKCVKIANVGVQEFIVDSENNLPLELYEKHLEVIVHSGDLVIALTRSIISSGLKVAIVPKIYDGTLLNQRVALIRAKKGLSEIKFIYFSLCSKASYNYVEEKARSLMQPNLSVVDLKTKVSEFVFSRIAVVHSWFPGFLALTS